MTRAQALELTTLTLLAALLAASLPLGNGYFGLSWDALNHHVYLGMIAERPRWHLDVLPASFQGYQYPYLYWPVYRLTQSSMSGANAGAVWSALQAALVLPPIWLVCHRLLPGTGAVQGFALRGAGCALAFISIVVLAGLESSANDLLAAVPLLWAVALGLADRPTDRRAFACAALWGVSVAFKLSNGLYVTWLLIWWWCPAAPHLPLRRAIFLAAGAVAGFAVAYAPWGWQLWTVTGNPFHPLFGSFFGVR